MTNTDVDAAERFIAKWKESVAYGPSCSQSFLIDLCELQGLDRSHATAAQDYKFERPLTLEHANGSKNDRRSLAPGHLHCFSTRGPWKKRLPQRVEMLVALGRPEAREGGVVGTRH